MSGLRDRRRKNVRPAQRRTRVHSRRSLRFEALESRQLLATLVVNSLGDDVTPGDGLVTLREAINVANYGGTTDLEDGLLVCTGCHHRIHDDGWDIEIDGAGMDATIWFLPPPWLDPQRTPRLGGAARCRLAEVGG